MNKPYSYIRLKDGCIEIEEFDSLVGALTVAEVDFDLWDDIMRPICIVNREDAKVYDINAIEGFLAVKGIIWEESQ